MQKEISRTQHLAGCHLQPKTAHVQPRAESQKENSMSHNVGMLEIHAETQTFLLFQSPNQKQFGLFQHAGHNNRSILELA